MSDKQVIVVEPTKQDEQSKAKTAVTVTTTPAQYAAIRKLSLKYTDVSVEQMAAKLFNQVVRNYYTTETKQIAKKAGDQWDMAESAGFDTKMTREEYVKRAIAEAKAILNELA